MALFWRSRFIISMRFCKHLIIVLVFLCSFSFAQEKSLNGSIPVAKTPVDSAAYYQKMYEYNLEKYHKDTLSRDVMMWTFWGSMSVTMLALGYKMMSDLSAGESQKLTIGEKIGIFVPFGIMTVSCISYITFEIAAAVRHSKYNKYYQKWNDFQKRNSAPPDESMRVEIMPLLNPLDGRYGAALAFSF